MTDLYIDISDGSCAAGCRHCKHGSRASSGEAFFPEELVSTYRRLEEYARKEKQQVRAAFMNKLSTLPAVPFIGANMLSLILNGVGDITGGNKAAVVDRLMHLGLDYGALDTVEFHVHPPFDLAELSDVTFLYQVLELQVAVWEKLPQRKVYVGFDSNTHSSTLSWEELQLKAYGIVTLYQRMAQQLQKEKISKSFMQVTKDRIALRFFCEIEHEDGKSLSVGGRFIDAERTPEKSEQSISLGIEGQLLPIALFPDVVHLDHSTMNINDRSLKFTYEEFGELLGKAESGGSSLKQICWEAVSLRKGRTIDIATA